MQTNLTIQKFDPEFQKEIISLMISTPSFSTKFFSLLYKDQDIAKSGTNFFSVPIFQALANCYYECFKKNYDVMPSDGMIRNFISEKYPEDKASQLFEVLSSSKDIEIDNYQYHKEQVLKHWKYIKYVSLASGLNEAIQSGKIAVLDFENIFKKNTEAIFSATFDMGEFITFKNAFDIIDENARMVTDAIKLGIPPLDAIASDGFGFTKSNTLLIFGSSNDGKSMMFSVEVAVNIAKSGRRVFIVNLEGEKYLLPIRVIACYTGIEMSKIDQYANVINGKVKATCFKEYFTEEEYKKIEESCEILERIEVYHTASSKNKDSINVENIAAVVEEKMKVWPFDVLITDYLGIAKTEDKSKGELAAKIHCYKEMDYLAKRHTFLHIAIGQANREGIKEQKGDANNDRRKDKPILREYQLGGGLQVFLDSAFAISISADPQEKKNGIRRLTLLKNRKGPVDVTVEIKGEWSKARPLTGEMKVLDSTYEDYVDHDTKGTKKNGLELIQGVADQEADIVYKIFEGVLDAKKVLVISESFIEFGNLVKAIKANEDKIELIKNESDGKEALEKIDTYKKANKKKIEDLKLIKLDEEFIIEFETSIMSQKDKILSILNECKKKNLNPLERKDLKAIGTVLSYMWDGSYKFLESSTESAA